MSFQNPILGGTNLVRTAIRSKNYVAGSSGWSINANGSAEFAGSITINLGGGSGQPRVSIGGQIPAELVTYYTTSGLGTLPETVVGGNFFYDGLGNYFYQVEIYDSSVSRITSIAYGSSFAGTVKEAYRISMYTADGHQNAFYNRTKLTMHTGLVDTPTFVLLGGSLGSDNNADRFQLAASGALSWGPGGANQAQDTTLYRAAAGVAAASNLVSNIAGAAETWHALTLNSSYVNQGGSLVTAQYRKLPLGTTGMVEVVGAITGGSTHVDNTVIATLPTGYRPSHTVTNPVWCSATTAGGQSAAMDLDSSGNLTIFGCASNVIDFHFFVPLDA